MLQDICDHPEAHWVHPIYVAGLSDLTSKSGLNEAQIAGWRYLARMEGNRNYGVELELKSEKGDYTFAELDKGPFLDGMFKVLEDEDISGKIAAGLLKPAVLRINAMGVFAVWLRAEKPSKEIIIVMPPAPSYLEPWPARYTVKRFQTILSGAVKRRMKAGDNRV